MAEIQRLKSLFVANDYDNEDNHEDDDDIEVIQFSESEKTKHVFSPSQRFSIPPFSSSPTTSSPFAIFKLIEHKINTLKEKGDTAAQATLLEGLTDQVLLVLKTAQQNASDASDLASLKAKVLKPFLENSQDLEQKILVLDPVRELIEEVIQLANPKRNDNRSESMSSANSFAFSSQNKQFKGRLSDQSVSSSSTSPSTSFCAYASNNRQFGKSRWKLPKIESKGWLADKNKKAFKFQMDEPKVYYVEHKTVTNVRPQSQNEIDDEIEFLDSPRNLPDVPAPSQGITAAADKEISKIETSEVALQLTNTPNQVNEAAESATKEDRSPISNIFSQLKAAKNLHERKQQVKNEPASNSPIKTVSPLQPASIFKKKNEVPNQLMDITPFLKTSPTDESNITSTLSNNPNLRLRSLTSTPRSKVDKHHASNSTEFTAMAGFPVSKSEGNAKKRKNLGHKKDTLDNPECSKSTDSARGVKIPKILEMERTPKAEIDEKPLPLLKSCLSTPQNTQKYKKRVSFLIGKPKTHSFIVEDGNTMRKYEE